MTRPRYQRFQPPRDENGKLIVRVRQGQIDVDKFNRHIDNLARNLIARAEIELREKAAAK